MRVVRFPARPARVSDDIRAALTSLGRGTDSVGAVGGVALLGVSPPDSDLVVDAVLVLPRGVLVVVGVDLPDPAVELTAPLDGEWKADGWALTRPGDDPQNGALNPAVAALTLAGRCADHIHALDPGVAVGVIIAVGPYVERVEQPGNELAGPVRVIHPSAASMMAATEALPPTTRPLTTEQARTVLRGLAPSATELNDAALSDEGFSRTRPDTPVPPTAQLWPAAIVGQATGTTPSAPAGSTSRRVSGRVATAIAALVFLVAGSITLITATSDGSPAPASGSTGSSEVPQTDKTPVTVNGVSFTPVARDLGTACTPRDAVGDVQSYLVETGCVSLRRASFTTTLDGHTVAVSAADVTLDDEARAEEFHALADTPGSGTLTDAATRAERWPDAVPLFANAAYTSERDGATVRLVLADVVRGENAGTEEVQLRVARSALRLPLG